MKQFFSILFLLLAFSACGGGGGGEGDSEPTHLTVTFKYDATSPDLAGFRLYNYSDRTLLIDSANSSTYCNINECKSQTQPATLTFNIPLSEITYPELRRGMRLSITAYVNHIDGTVVESAFSAPVTIQ